MKSKKVRADAQTKINPSHKLQIQRVNRVTGQLAGIVRMIEARRYCPDILIQVQASVAALKSLQLAILETHMRHCVKDAVMSKNHNETDTKIDELVALLRRHR